MQTHLYISIVLALYIIVDGTRNRQHILMAKQQYLEAGKASKLWHPISSMFVVLVAIVPALWELPPVGVYVIPLYGSLYWLFHELACNIGLFKHPLNLGDGSNDFPNNWIKWLSGVIKVKPHYLKAFVHMAAIAFSVWFLLTKPLNNHEVILSITGYLQFK